MHPVNSPLFNQQPSSSFASIIDENQKKPSSYLFSFLRVGGLITLTTNVLIILALLQLYSPLANAEWEDFGDYTVSLSQFKDTTRAEAREMALHGCNAYIRRFNRSGSNDAIRFYALRCVPYYLSVVNRIHGFHVEYDYDVCVNGSVRDWVGGDCRLPEPTFGHAPEVNAGGSAHNTCKPINIATGNKYYQENDSPNSFNGLNLSRSYNTSTKDWLFNFRQRLVISEYHKSITSIRPDGKHVSFATTDGGINKDSQRSETLSFSGSEYTLTLSGNVQETYSEEGQLLSISRPHEALIHLQYIDNTILISKDNKTLIIVLEDDRVIQATLPDESVVSYSYYNLYGNEFHLASVSHNGNIIRKYFYDTRFKTAITGIEDANGNRISSVKYDSLGRAISSEAGPLNSGIERTQIQYNEDGTRTLTNALGKQSTYHFTQFNGEYKMTQVEGHPSANCASANKNYTYDSNGFISSKTDWQGNMTTYIHNDRGQETSRTEASGTPQARTITTEWHAEFNLPIKIIEPKRETVMSYDTNGRLLSSIISEKVR